MRISFLVVLLFSFRATAEDITLYKGEVITLAINEIDTIVDLPRPIRLIPETKSYFIEGIPDRMDKDGNPLDFKSLRVRRRGKSPGPEKVPLLLAHGINLNVRLVSTISADRHYRLRLPKQQTSQIHDASFLEQELQLMKLMLRDEQGNGFQCQRFKKELKIEGYDGLNLQLVRRYKGNQLLGYVFKLVNTSDDEITIHPQALNFGSPNKAVALQYDHAKLQPCHINNSANPKGTGCLTAIRLVVRGDNWESPASKSSMPWQLARSKK